MPAQHGHEYRPFEGADAGMEKITEYLSSVKSDKTRAGAKEIVEFLLKKRDEHEGEGWIRSGEIYKTLRDHIPNPNTLTRLLKDLVKAEIIDRQDCPRVKGRAGKAPVFYRVPQGYNPCLFYSRDELIKQFVDLKDQVTAYKYTVSHELKDHPDIHEKFDESYKANLKKIKKTKEIYAFLSDWARQNPCKSL